MAGEGGVKGRRLLQAPLLSLAVGVGAFEVEASHGSDPWALSRKQSEGRTGRVACTASTRSVSPWPWMARHGNWLNGSSAPGLLKTDCTPVCACFDVWTRWNDADDDLYIGGAGASLHMGFKWISEERKERLTAPSDMRFQLQGPIQVRRGNLRARRWDSELLNRSANSRWPIRERRRKHQSTHRWPTPSWSPKRALSPVRAQPFSD